MATQEFTTAWAERLEAAEALGSEITWSRFTGLAAEGVDLIEIHVAQMVADSEAATSMLADPLPHLARGIPAVSHYWNVQVERVNAERSLHGPRKLVIAWTIIPELVLAKGLAYRIPS